MLKKTVIFTIIILFAIQFIPVEKTNPPVDESLTLKASPEVMHILKKGCYDCHSDETKWPYYSDIAPMSFFVASHVKNGRKAMNFSHWNQIEEIKKIKRLKRGVITVNNGMMALPSYLSMHEESELDAGEKAIITAWFKSEVEALNKERVDD